MIVRPYQTQKLVPQSTIDKTILKSNLTWSNIVVVIVWLISKIILLSKFSWLRLQLHGTIYRPDSFVLMLRQCANFKAIRYEPTSLNRFVADKWHRVIGAVAVIWTIAKLCTIYQTKVATRTKQFGKCNKFWPVAIVFVIVLDHLFDERTDLWLVHISFFSVLITVAKSLRKSWSNQRICCQTLGFAGFTRFCFFFFWGGGLIKGDILFRSKNEIAVEEWNWNKW